METKQLEPISLLPSPRHDGWTGEAMAKFLETLAETGIVMEACAVARKSREGAYALRRRNPLFAGAWEQALANARDVLADNLLSRSIEGNVEQIIKDGEIVAEKHFIDNRLSLAILKRIDQRIDGSRNRKLVPAMSEQAEPDWDVAIRALHTAREEDIAAALAMLRGPEVDKVDTAVIDEIDAGDGAESFDHPRIWREWQSGEWRTNYPPPPGFEGEQNDDWEGEDYRRSLSLDEMAALVAAGIAEPAEMPDFVSVEEDEAERDAFFASLIAHPDAFAGEQAAAPPELTEL